MSTTVLEFSNENGLLNQTLTGYCLVIAHAKQNPKETATTKHALSGQKRENKGLITCGALHPSLFYSRTVIMSMSIHTIHILIQCIRKAFFI